MEGTRLCLCGCLAALPLLGCAANVGTSAQATAVTPAALAEPEPNYAPAPRVYAVGPAAPAAVLVLWPGDDTLARDPALWTAQGFDVVMPPLANIYRLVADQQAAVAQLVASARALAHAPIWIVGPGPVIDAALAAPQLGRGVSGVVMMSVASDSGSCNEKSSTPTPAPARRHKSRADGPGIAVRARPRLAGGSYRCFRPRPGRTSRALSRHRRWGKICGRP